MKNKTGWKIFLVISYLLILVYNYFKLTEEAFVISIFYTVAIIGIVLLDNWKK